jgi:hypothetical protein
MYRKPVNANSFKVVVTQMWIVPVTIAVLALVILLMPKHITWREIIYTWAVVGYIAWIGDMIISVIFDLYDIGPTKEATPIDIFAISMIPAQFSIVFLNFLPKKNNRIWLYAIVWTLLTFLFEWLTTYTGYMDNKGWKTWYSLPGYFFVYLFFLRWHLKYFRKQLGVTNN